MELKVEVELMVQMDVLVAETHWSVTGHDSLLI